MGGFQVRFKFNEAEFRRMTETGSIAQATWRAAGKVRDDAKQELTAAGRIDTGGLRNSIVGRRIRSGRSGVFYEVGTPVEYAMFQHEGTRDHGPRRAKILRFKPKGSGVYVFAHKVKGVTALPFLTNALRKLRASDFIGGGGIL